MLAPDEELAIATQFGVAKPQVKRDHLISHLLAALSEHVADQLIFFGGTALSRTFAPAGRLSEDIDLIARHDRSATAAAVEHALVHATRREYPGLHWQPRLTAVRGSAPAILTAPDGTSVRIQLLSAIGYAPWPTERRKMVQRYSDAPPARLIVPTAASFAAWKTSTWIDRAASRDLYDLWLLAQIGAIDAEASVLFAKYGPTNNPPNARQLAHPPDEATWQRELAGQTRLAVTAADALAEVREAWLR